MAKMRFARKKAYFPTNLTQLNSIFIFHACAKAISFLRSYFDLSLSLSFFFPLPFFYIDGFVAHFIVLLLQGILAG